MDEATDEGRETRDEEPSPPVRPEERPFTKEDVAAVLNALDPFWTRAITPDGAGEGEAVVA